MEECIDIAKDADLIPTYFYDAFDPFLELEIEKQFDQMYWIFLSEP